MRIESADSVIGRSERPDFFVKAYRAVFRGLIDTLKRTGVEITPSDEDWAKEVLWTNAELRRNWKIYEHKNNAFDLHENPAQELVSVNPTQPERINWHKQWEDAHGEFIEGRRMIALKSDTVWSLISGLGYPFPPFAHESSMGFRDIARREAIRFGLLDKATAVKLSHIDRPDAVVW